MNQRIGYEIKVRATFPSDCVDIESLLERLREDGSAEITGVQIIPDTDKAIAEFIG